MSSINSIAGSGYSTMMSGMKPPDPSKMVDNLFSKLDTTSKGYITKSDLQSAMDQLAGSGSSSGTSSSASVDEIFKKLDTNGDSKITKEEMTSGMKNLASSHQGQLHQTGRGTPPSGSRSSPSSSTSSASAAKTTSSTKIYQAADTNQDGTVSLQEEIAYALLTQNSASASASATSSSTSTNSDARVMKQIVDLLRTYGSVNSSSSSSGLSVTA